MYRLPKSLGSHVVKAARGPGRPRIYLVPTLTVTFRVPAELREQGSKKAKGRVNLTKLFAMYYRDFLREPIEKTQKFMEEWEKRYGPITEDEA
jgi:hypothetical protein